MALIVWAFGSSYVSQSSESKTPVLLDRFEELSPKRQATLEKEMNSLKNRQGIYESLVDIYLKYDRTWLANSAPESNIKIKSELLLHGAWFVQHQLETYCTWNDGVYPENLEDLLVKEWAGLTRLCENPLTPDASKQVPVGTNSPGDFWYIPEYTSENGNQVATGYWLIMLGAEYLHLDPANANRLKPLPAGIDWPEFTFMILESHLE